MDDEATQPSTQQVLDPRRLGRNNSGLSDSDISDVLCILHPCSPAAFHIVKLTAERSPQHVLQNNGLVTFDDDGNVENVEEQETFILNDNQPNQAQDLALRFSSRTKQPCLGFTFGRNPKLCDIVFDIDTIKRVSNLHFRIYVNSAGVVMLQDMSTNGTLVDETHLRGKTDRRPATRMLNPGSIIQILSPREDEILKFILRIPSREGHQEEYARKFQAYMAHVALADQRQLARQGVPRNNGANGFSPLVVPFTGMAPSGGPVQQPPLMPANYTYGMHWNGGDEYNVVGHLGKGAFATVYQLATAMDGQPLAAKELEKKRFIKNGQLDQRLDNEMKIMKSLEHPNIVQYMDYRDVGNYLYIIMEYVPCGDLQGYLQRNGVLPEQSAKLMARQILRSLHYLHQRQITHRDIKPDNILIASEDPFTVKLSDFGLSKVVKNNETFLKTFCGTLLYCAPEVFPHYESYAGRKGTKRRRTGGSSQPNFHSYSQSVDIWSFAAVLWFAMCGKPPIEGVVDNTGRGMFDKIMVTRLDYSPLKAQGISDAAIDLLLKMLKTDPALRPTERDCLRHPWLYDGTELPEDDANLHAITEEAEDQEEEVEAQEGFSQLSIHDRLREGSVKGNERENEEEVLLDSGDFVYLNPHHSKRIKADRLFPRNQPRDPADIDSSPEVSYHSPHIAHNPEESNILPQPTKRAPRLFGEIGQSALESSGILGQQTNFALAVDRTGQSDFLTSADTDSRDTAPQDVRYNQFDGAVDTEPASAGVPTPEGGAQAAASLLGAESLVRELNMASPHSVNSPTPDDPSSPKTPEPQHPLMGSRERDAEQHSRPEEVTPKAPPSFSRQINLPLPPSFYYDPNDPSTHNLEYASRVSGRDFVAEAAASGLVSLPATMTGPLQQEAPHATPSTVGLTASPPPDFLRPPPRLGKLVSTKDSFTTIALKFDKRLTTWGRNPANTVTYPDKYDTRIPKVAISIWFHAVGIEKAEKENVDWTKMEGLYTIINTYSRQGIWVNGVHLRDQDKDGNYLFGRVYTGDVITVFQEGRDGQCLKFVCEFFHGAAANRRPAGSRFEIQSTERLTRPSPSA